MNRWLRLVDRIAVVLLAIFAAGHGIVGTLLTVPLMEVRTVWSFSGAVAAWLVAALNWLRGSRPGDRPLAAWAIAGALAYAALMVWLAFAAHLLDDVRPWLFFIVCLILAAIGFKDLGARPD